MERMASISMSVSTGPLVSAAKLLPLLPQFIAKSAFSYKPTVFSRACKEEAAVFVPADVTCSEPLNLVLRSSCGARCNRIHNQHFDLRVAGMKT